MTKAKPTAPETLGMHVRRPSDASAAAKAAKADKRAAEAARRNGWNSLSTSTGTAKTIHKDGVMLPALAKERQREFEARLTRVQAPSAQVRMCNATMPGSYRTGDGEVRQAERPGSGVAYGLPSHGDRT